MAEQLRPVLDRRVQFDERSKQFPIKAVLPSQTPRSYSWRTNAWLDQGSEGACVGFGWSHYLASRPKEEPNITNSFAVKLYTDAKKVDEWPGENYDGTSVIAGAKVTKTDAYIKEYRWAFGLDDVILTLGRVSPVVLGINWYDDMFNPDPKTGIITVTGALAGGHCIVANGVNISKKLVRLHNSWGKGWGKSGECYISFADLDKLLKQDGEACVPLTKVLKSN